MSYKTINASFQDEALVGRITACCAQEHREPLTEVIHAVCVASDVEQAYAYAITAENPDPGGDENVVTDPMILGNVQAFFSGPTPPNILNPQ
ncbi:MAG TPA: hypothetical protein VFE69_01155 [Ilumatobacteraceae bacterium]|jgi:hypothetical protein|nr:hypothetical protein [Ilumatobacteraceae bacterium]